MNKKSITKIRAMRAKSIEEIHALRKKGYNDRFLRYLGFDATLVSNAGKGAYAISPLVDGATRDELLAQGFTAGAIDLAFKMAGRSETPVKPKRSIKDLIVFSNRGRRTARKLAGKSESPARRKRTTADLIRFAIHGRRTVLK